MLAPHSGHKAPRDLRIDLFYLVPPLRQTRIGPTCDSVGGEGRATCEAQGTVRVIVPNLASPASDARLASRITFNLRPRDTADVECSALGGIWENVSQIRPAKSLRKTVRHRRGTAVRL